MNKLPFRTKQELLDEIPNLKLSYIDRFLNELRFGDCIIKLAADGSTFRAYRNSPIHTPSSIFRTWAHENFFNEGKYFKEINSEGFITQYDSKDKFKELHDRINNDFNDYWKHCNEGKHELNYGQQRKLVDLFLKFYVIYDKLNDSSRKMLISLINVPLDQFSLYLIKDIYEENRLSNNINLNPIPTNVSMGFIKDEKHYWYIQNLIQLCCDNYPAIYYDFVAWNSQHSDKLKIEDLVQKSKDYKFTPGLIKVNKNKKQRKTGNFAR